MITMFVHPASPRPSVLAVLTESELVMLDVSKPAEEVQCGDDTVLRLANYDQLSKNDDKFDYLMTGYYSSCLPRTLFCSQLSSHLQFPRISPHHLTSHLPSTLWRVFT